MKIELLIPVLIKRFTDTHEKRIIKIDIMHYAKPHCKHLSAFKQMTDICSCKIAAYGAVTFIIKRLGIKRIFLIIHIPAA